MQILFTSRCLTGEEQVVYAKPRTTVADVRRMVERLYQGAVKRVDDPKANSRDYWLGQEAALGSVLDAMVEDE